MNSQISFTARLTDPSEAVVAIVCGQDVCVQLTMTADVSNVVTLRRGLPPGYRLRPGTRGDIDLLGALYFASYPSGIAGATTDEAREDSEAAFDGVYGELWVDAPFVAEYEGHLVGAIQIVRSAPWDDVPTGPFILELFVDPRHRRRGLARTLLAQSLNAIGAAGESCVALRPQLLTDDRARRCAAGAERRSRRMVRSGAADDRARPTSRAECANVRGEQTSDHDGEPGDGGESKRPIVAIGGLHGDDAPARRDPSQHPGEPTTEAGVENA